MIEWLEKIIVNKNDSRFNDSNFKKILDKNNYSKIKIDSRKIEPHDIFLPITGENFNAHLFIKDILDKIDLFFYDQKGLDLLKQKNLSLDLSKGVELTDTNITLSFLAKGIVKDFIKPANSKIFALTGSLGKTTVRTMIIQGLKEEGVLYAEGNFNNEIGVPLTLLQYNKNIHKYVVLEFGARHPNDINILCELASPDISICINVKSSHMQEFKTLENIYKTKSEIFDFGSTLVCLYDDPILLKNAISKEKKLITFGLDNKADVTLKKQFLIHKKDLSSYIKNIEGIDKIKDSDIIFDIYTGIILNINSTDYTFIIPNYHEAYGINLAAATAALISQNIKISTLQKRMLGFKNVGSRFEITKKNNYTIVNDCYNASSESMIAGINSFYTVFYNSPKILVVGDMLELGDKSQDYHLSVANNIIEHEPYYTICIGKESEIIYNKLKTKGLNTSYFVSTKNLDYSILDKLIEKNKNCSFYIKASHSMDFIKIVNYLKNKKD